jgi:hypothetical protein
MEGQMPIVEFALDSTAQQRIQVHLPEVPSGAVTVLLNRSILGSLTQDEQVSGKDFRLPDNSFVNVRVVNGQPQVARAGYLLPPVDAATLQKLDDSPAAQARRKLGGCLIAWLVLNLLVIGGFTVIYFLAIFGALAKGTSPLPFFLFGLLGIVGVVGIILVFFWKKIGFYLMAAYVVLNILVSIPLGYLDVRSFIPLIPIAILYVYLNRSGIWDQMS